MLVGFSWSCHSSVHAGNAVLEGVPGAGEFVVVLNPEIGLAEVVGEVEVLPLLVGAEPPTFLGCDVEAWTLYVEVCWLEFIALILPNEIDFCLSESIIS